MTSLHEATIREFLLGLRTAGSLDTEAREAVREVSPATHRVDIVDMTEDFVIAPLMLTRLCDAVADGLLSGEALRHVAFAIIASDRFDWEDDIAGEVLHDWAAPEINYPLTSENMKRFRSWLLRDEAYPEKPAKRSEG